MLAPTEGVLALRSFALVHEDGRMDMGERTPIHIDDVPWEDFVDPLDLGRGIGPMVRYLVDPIGEPVMHIRSRPGAAVRRRTGTSPTRSTS